MRTRHGNPLQGVKLGGVASTWLTDTDCRVGFGRNFTHPDATKILWLLACGVCYRSDQASASECHHGYCQARRDEVDADDQPQRPGGSAWPSLDDERGQDQIGNATCQHPSP